MTPAIARAPNGALAAPTRCADARPLRARAARARCSTASPTRPRTWWPTRAPPRPVAAMRDRLGHDHRLPRRLWSHGPRRGRSDGHGAARHGARLADLARADPPHARCRERRARRAASQRLRHRPPRADGATQRRRRDPRLRGADGGDRAAWRQADRDGQPRARPRGARPGRLRARLRPRAAAGAGSR